MGHALFHALTTGIATGLLLFTGCEARSPEGPEQTWSLPGNWRGEGAGLQAEFELFQAVDCQGIYCANSLLGGVARFRVNPTAEWYTMQVDGYCGSSRQVSFTVNRWGGSPARQVATGTFSGAFQSDSVLAGTVSFSSDTVDPNFGEFAGRAYAITLTRS